MHLLLSVGQYIDNVNTHTCNTSNTDGLYTCTLEMEKGGRQTIKNILGILSPYFEIVNAKK